MNKKAMYNLTYGLFVLTSRLGEKDSGCIINTAGQVTSSPNRISITVNKDNFTHDLVKESGKFNISVLSERASFETFRHFGFQSGRTTDKFDGYDACRRSENGLYYITDGTNAYISATVEASEGKTVWRCTVCGYVYEGEELPADFICPLCKHPASDFEKVTA